MTIAKKYLDSDYEDIIEKPSETIGDYVKKQFNNPIQTMEERFDKQFSAKPARDVIKIIDLADSFGYKFDYSDIKAFIKQEQSRLLKELMNSKNRIGGDCIYDDEIKAVAKAWGIGL